MKNRMPYKFGFQLCFYGVLSTCLQVAFAAPISGQVTESRKTLPRSEKKSVVGKLNLTSSTYLSPVRNGKSSAFVPTLNLDLGSEVTGNILEAKGQFIGNLTLNDVQDWHVDFEQLYLASTKSAFTLQSTLGRRLEFWNGMDEYWNLGLLQPRTRWDYMSSQNLGLTGLFLGQETETQKWFIFGSYLYVPERGPTYRVNNGDIESSNPWFPRVPSQMAILGQPTKVRYRFEIPSTSDILFRPSVGGAYRLGNTQSEWVQGSYAYKPMNQLLMSYDGLLDLSRPNQEVLITIKPRVVNHHIASLETGLTRGRLSGWISGTYDEPEQDQQAPKWTSQYHRPSMIASSVVKYRLTGKGESAITTEIGYFYLFGGQSFDRGPLAPSSGSVFESRYPFRNALSGTLKTSFPGALGKKFKFSTRITQDFVQDGSLLSSKLFYRPLSDFEINLGVDILGVSGKSKTNKGEPDFIGQYQANDRVFGGISYVF